MKKIGTLLDVAKKQMIEHSPDILTGLGIAGMFGAIIFAIQATPKAEKAIKKRKTEAKKNKLTIGEIIAATWKYYIPTAASFAVGTVCVLSSDTISKKRAAALTAAYSITETALSEYKSKVLEEIGEKDEKKIFDKISEDAVKKDPPKANEIAFITKDGILFREPTTKRYFNSTNDKVRRAENELNKDMRSAMFISLNDVYYALGLEMTDPIMDDIGWHIDYDPIEFVITPVAISDDQVCWAIQYRYAPQHKSRFGML